jgi:plastocyanin
MLASRTGRSRAFTLRATLATTWLLIVMTAVLVAETDATGAVVIIKNFQFATSPVTIAVGQTVTWQNKDSVDHWVAPDPYSPKFTPSPRIPPGGKYTVKFQKLGTYTYHDAMNPFMTGTIFVKSAPAATPKPTPRPTVRPTAKPIARATVKPTAKPTPKATASPATAPSASAAPSEAGIAQVSIEPGASSSSGGLGAGTSPGSSDTASASSGLFGIVVILGLVGLAFLAGVGITMTRRGRPVPLAAANAVANPVIPVMPTATVETALPPTLSKSPASRRRPVAGQPRSVEREASENPSFPYDVDEDAPIASSRPGRLEADEPSEGGPEGGALA